MVMEGRAPVEFDKTCARVISEWIRRYEDRELSVQVVLLAISPRTQSRAVSTMGSVELETVAQVEI